jgi:hypothetical protein
MKKGLVLSGLLFAAPAAFAVFPTTLFEVEVGDPATATMINEVALGRDSGWNALGRNTNVVLLNPDLSPLLTYGGYTGLMRMTIEDPTGAPKKLRDMLCVELTRQAPLGLTAYGKYEGYGRVGWLVKQMPKIVKAADGLSGAALDPFKNQMAGLQVAVWEVVYDVIAMGGTANLADGVFRHVSSTGYHASVKGWAQHYLDVSAGKRAGYHYFTNPNPFIGDGTGRQDFGAVIPGPAAAVPFLTAFLAMRRRKKN